MPLVELTLVVKMNGRDVDGFPVRRTLQVDEVQFFDFEKAGDADAVTFTAVPASEVADIRALLLRSDKQVTLRVDGQTDKGIVINAGGLVLLLDVTIDEGAGASNAKLNHNAAATVLAAIKGFCGGT